MLTPFNEFIHCIVQYQTQYLKYKIIPHFTFMLNILEKIHFIYLDKKLQGITML